MLNRLFASRKRPFLSGLNNPQHIEMDISGSKLELDVPAHNDASLPEQQAPLSHFNLYTTEGFDPDDGTFSTALLMGRDLDLYAAPFGLSSSMGTISVKVAIDRVDCLPEGMTCLNPEHFEQVVIRVVYDMGPGSCSGRIGPRGWRLMPTEHLPWVVYEMHRDLTGVTEFTSHDFTQYSSYAVTPLDDRYILRIMFRNLGSPPVEFSRRVRDQICRSLKLTLSTDLTRRIAEVKDKWPDAKISGYREPEQWLQPKWRNGRTSEGEPHVVILEAGSPAPEFKFEEKFNTSK